MISEQKKGLNETGLIIDPCGTPNDVFKRIRNVSIMLECHNSLVSNMSVNYKQKSDGQSKDKLCTPLLLHIPSMSGGFGLIFKKFLSMKQ